MIDPFNLLIEYQNNLISGVYEDSEDTTVTIEQRIALLFDLLNWCEENDYPGLVKPIVQAITRLTEHGCEYHKDTV